jgi:ELWxxDGT repeat protein
VKELSARLDGSPSYATLGGTFFFAASRGSEGTELWRSDGTEAGTLLVKDLEPGPGSSYPSGFVAVSSRGGATGPLPGRSA